MRRHKITRAHQEYFQDRVLFWMEELNQQDWTNTGFKVEDLGTGAAQIRYNVLNRGCTFVLSSSLDSKITRRFLDETALHEVGHLVMSRLENLAERRYIQEDDLSIAAEEAVCILTRVVSKYYNRKK